MQPLLVILVLGAQLRPQLLAQLVLRLLSVALDLWYVASLIAEQKPAKYGDSFECAIRKIFFIQW